MKPLLLLASALILTRALAAEGPLRVAYLGNSLTYANDLPALVQAMARHGGRQIEYTERARANYALEDHWNDGARGLFRRKPDVLIMQQGPSTLPESRTHLEHWTKRWAEAARAAGTRPVLYMVWPYATQAEGFFKCSQSYRSAAAAGATGLYPAGEAWALALHEDPALELYEPDALHPTPTGTYLAALVIARGLTGLDPEVVPAKLQLRSGRSIEIPEPTAALFRRLVRQLHYAEPGTSAAHTSGATAP